MESRILPRPEKPSSRAPAPSPDDDPFADLLADSAPAAPEAPPAAVSDDAGELRDLFADAPEARPSRPAARAPAGSHWPTHNYGDAYLSLRRQRRVPYGPRVVSESDVWDVNALTEEIAPPVADPEPVPWKTHTEPPPHTDTAAAWLDGLTGDAAVAETTEARLVDVIWGGRRVEETLLEATEVLWARPRTLHARPRQHTATETPRFPRTLEIAALAVLLLFAVAVLQLLLS